MINKYKRIPIGRHNCNCINCIKTPTSSQKVIATPICKECEIKKLRKGKTDAETHYKELSKFFSIKNIVSLSEIYYKNNDKWIFECEICKKEIRKTIKQFLKTKRCKTHENMSESEEIKKLLDTIKPYISKNNIYEIKNYAIDPTINSGIIFLTCPNCGIEYRESIFNLNNHYSKLCENCYKRICFVGLNDIKTNHPNIIPFLTDDYEIEKTIAFNFPYSIKCPHCNFVFYNYDHDYNGELDKCPYCTNRCVMKGFNDAKTFYPNDEEYFIGIDYERFDNIPYATTNKKYLYLCRSKKHIHFARPQDFANCQLETCFKCRQIKKYSILIHIPEMLEEWNFVLNYMYNIDEVFFTSSKIAWWKCKECGIDYPMIIREKTNLYKNNIKGCSCHNNLTIKKVHFF